MAIMTVIGAILLLWFSLPFFIQTLRTRDTTNLSYLMWSFYLCASFFLLVPGLVNPIVTLTKIDVNNIQKVAMIPLLIIGITNVIALLIAIILICLKAINQRKAKKAGMTEKEYCTLHNPVLKKQAAMIIDKENVKSNM